MLLGCLSYVGPACNKNKSMIDTTKSLFMQKLLGCIGRQEKHDLQYVMSCMCLLSGVDIDNFTTIVRVKD